MDERVEDWKQFWEGEALYAFVEQRADAFGADGGRTETAWTLDVLRARDVAYILRAGPRARGELSFVASAQVVVKHDVPPPGNLDALEEGRWCEAKLGPREAFPATVFRDLDGVDLFGSMISTNPADEAVQAALRDVVSLDDISDATDADMDLARARIRHVAVLDVGQGNCNALCDRRGAPVVYFDLGAGCLWNAHTRPASLAFCATRSPPVVLSHWDFDHWFGAELPENSDFLTTTWLVPKQHIGARTRKFAAKLAKTATLRLWPKLKQRRAGPGLEIVQCGGKSKNDTGLAVFAKTAAGYVLCPGDASFDHVPIPRSVRGRALAGLVAPHHGSPASIGAPVPRPATSAAPLAFSFGAGNTYGHPGSSPATYASEGWVSQFTTSRGAIALGAPRRCALCGGWCSLGTSQP